MPKSFFIDTSRCTACRGCQIACKEWHELPANKTKQVGTHQNPPDLNPNNYKLVRFSEHKRDGKVIWNFFPDQCRHCVDPPCKLTADMYVQNAITQDDATGAVLFTEATQYLGPGEVQDVIDACPYDIPRLDTGTGRLTKCTMCFSRIRQNMLPMCVKACPTGTMNFGERSKMLDMAKARLAALKKEYPNAMLLDEDSVNAVFLVIDAPENYHEYAVAKAPTPYAPKSKLVQFIASRSRSRA